MSTTPTDTQTQAKLDRIISGVQDLKSGTNNDRLFNVLEIVRDQVDRLSHEHESIRREIREVANLVIQQSTAAAD